MKTETQKNNISLFLNKSSEFLFMQTNEPQLLYQMYIRTYFMDLQQQQIWPYHNVC